MGDANGVAAEAERFAIGISFGNTSSSIARISPVRSHTAQEIICQKLTNSFRRARLRLLPTRREVCFSSPVFNYSRD